MQTHSACARLPARPGIWRAQAGTVFPRRAAVVRFEQRGVFHTRVNVVGRIETGLEMPHAFEFPRMLRAVVPLMRAGDSVINENVALAFRHAVWTFYIVGAPARSLPGFAAVCAPLYV